MKKYKLLKNGWVLDQETGASIPNSNKNRHWQEYLDWYAEGNTPEPLDIPDPWIDIRAKRDRRLRESDWTQLLDSPVNQAQWAEYRQQLRDIPQNYVNAEDVIWPTVPNIS